MARTGGRSALRDRVPGKGVCSFAYLQSALSFLIPSAAFWRASGVHSSELKQGGRQETYSTHRSVAMISNTRRASFPQVREGGTFAWLKAGLLMYDNSWRRPPRPTGTHSKIDLARSCPPERTGSRQLNHSTVWRTLKNASIPEIVDGLLHDLARSNRQRFTPSPLLGWTSYLARNPIPWFPNQVIDSMEVNCRPRSWV